MKAEDYFVEGDLSDLKDAYHKRFVYELLSGNFYVKVLEDEKDCITYLLTIKTRYSNEEFKYYVYKDSGNIHNALWSHNKFIKRDGEELLKIIHNKALEVIENDKIEYLKYEIKSEIRLVERDLDKRIEKVNKLKEELNKLIK